MACTELVLKFIETKKNTTLVFYSKDYNVKAEEWLEQLQNLTKDVLLYTFDAVKTMDILYILIHLIILVAINASDITTFFHQWREVTNIHGQSKYIIYYFGPNQTVASYDQFAQAAWTVYVYNLVIVDELGNLYVQKELSFDNCDLTTTRKLTSCDQFQSANQTVELARIKNILERKYFNFQRCPITAMALNVPPFVVDVKSSVYRGLEPLYIEVIAEKINISLRYVDHNYTTWGLYKDGKFTCCMYVGFYNREADIMIGLIWPTVSTVTHFDISVPLMFTNTKFYIPLAKRQVPWMDIARIYTPNTWGILFGTAFFMVGFYYYTNKWQIIITNNSPRPKRLDINEISQSFLDILAIILTESIRLPTKLLNRIVIMSWILFAFIFSSTYEGVFLSFLMTPVYEKQIKTIPDVACSGLPIYGSLYTQTLFEMTGDPNAKKIVEHYHSIAMSDSMDEIQQVATEGNLIVVANSERVHYAMKVERRYLDRHNQSALYVSPSLVFYYTIVAMQKGLPIKTMTNKYIQILMESGWIDYYQRNVTMVMSKVQKEQSFVPINIDNILLAFFIYLAGMGSATITYLYERFKASRDKNKVIIKQQKY